MIVSEVAYCFPERGYQGGLPFPGESETLGRFILFFFNLFLYYYVNTLC